MKDEKESIRFLIEYVLIEGWPLFSKLPMSTAVRKISLMIHEIIIKNGYVFEKNQPPPGVQKLCFCEETPKAGKAKRAVSSEQKAVSSEQRTESSEQ